MIYTIKTRVTHCDAQYYLHLSQLDGEIRYQIYLQDRIVGAMVFQDILEVIKKYYNCSMTDVMIYDDHIELHT